MTSPSTSSGLLAASAVVMAIPGRLMGLQIITDGTNAATVTVYDNATAASGKVLAKWTVLGLNIAGAPYLPTKGIVANNGLYASISGTGANCIVDFHIG